jgi:hypothetical protein
VFNGGLDRSIDGVRDYGWRPVGTEQHKKHFAVAHAGFK